MVPFKGNLISNWPNGGTHSGLYTFLKGLATIQGDAGESIKPLGYSLNALLGCLQYAMAAFDFSSIPYFIAAVQIYFFDFSLVTKVL